jgi:hypothetical protein
MGYRITVAEILSKGPGRISGAFDTALDRSLVLGYGNVGRCEALVERARATPRVEVGA